MAKEKDGRPDRINFFGKYRHLLILALIAALSFGLNFYAISKSGYGNTYYAAAIRSMTQNFRNFFYVSFDPAGVVSVDKPPLGLWVQALFVLVFGYHGWAMLLPQALAGTGSCIMMYILTAKYFGRQAGLISSLVFAVTPAVVVASRNNTMDMQLIFVLLAAAWFLFKAIEKSRWRYLFICALFIGLGFNVKMLEAYMILPAIVIVYLVFSKEKFFKRIIAGLIATLVMAAVSFAWVFAVDLTPSGSRPYVDSSTDNTVLELIIGHNGLERLYGQSMGAGGGAGGRMDGGGPGTGNNQGFGQNAPNGTRNGGKNGALQMPASNGSSGASASGTAGGNGQAPGAFTQGGPQGQNGSRTFSGGQNGGTGNQGGGGNDIGTAGFLRLWSSSDYGQASWLILFALFCIAAKFGRVHLRKLSLKQGVFLFWILWLVTMYGFFSFAAFWHRYYLCILAPAIAGLIGPGFVEMAKAFQEKRGWKQALLPLSFLVTFAVEIVHVWSYTALRAWLVPLMAAAATASVILMAIHLVRPKKLVSVTAACCVAVSLLAAPFYWALTPVIYTPTNFTMPYAGPELASTAAGHGAVSGQSSDSLEKYLVAHYKKGSYLVVSQRADDVAQFIIDTGLPAVSYGGFLGSDNSMTVTKLKELVKEGKVTYFLVSSGQGGSTNSDLISYVEKNATLISSSEYGGSSSQRSGSLYLFKS